MADRMPRLRFRLLVVVAAALLAAACGGEDASPAADRTVEIEMVDIAFAPATLSVNRGETVRFVFANTGALVHDAVVGDAEEQAAYARRSAGSGGAHDHGSGPPAVHVSPGKTGELTVTFDEAGTAIVGCHQPGHYDAGMRIMVEVS